MNNFRMRIHVAAIFLCAALLLYIDLELYQLKSQGISKVWKYTDRKWMTDDGH